MLEVAEREVGLGHALAGDREQRLRGVDAADDRAVVGGDAQEGAAAAAGVEHGLAGAEAGALDRRSYVGRICDSVSLQSRARRPHAWPLRSALVGVVVDIRGNSFGSGKLRFIVIRYGT